MTSAAPPADKRHDQWTLWEVFVQSSAGEPHEHAGSLRAPDAEFALQNARDVFARRGKVNSIWVVKSSEIAASMPQDAESFFDPADDKIYRHSHFYKLPKGMTDQ
jgi:ring-1,2-phenylacetyl-CoA epoxidase subunit PaaB